MGERLREREKEKGRGRGREGGRKKREKISTECEKLKKPQIRF